MLFSPRELAIVAAESATLLAGDSGGGAAL